MIDEKPAEGANLWGKSPPHEPWRWRRSNTPVNRLMGGSPVYVVLQLFFLSLIVGALLMWLDIRPQDVIQGVVHFFRHIWAMGFEAVRELGNYLLAGALIVVPVWLVMRLFNMRGPR
jgi:hypothetical protein